MDSQSKKSMFQTIVLIVCGFAALIAIGFFAINKGSVTKKKDTLSGEVTIWGTYPESVITTTLEIFLRDYPDLKVTYSTHNSETFEQELIEAMASASGPDIFMVTPEMIMRNRERLFPVPYTSFPDTLFKQTFINQANLFLLPEGVAGFPAFINPLVMYVNNDILTQNYVVEAPKTWEELTNLAPQLTKFTETGTIVQSLGGIGTYDNVTHAESIITTLLFQAGDPITKVSPGSSMITASSNQAGESVFSFYTGFSNPQSDFYTWNNAQVNDQDMFISGNSAVYFGLGSEVEMLRARNPNLNFSVHMVPTTGTFGKNAVYGELAGWGISKTSKNIGLAIQVLQQMSKKEFIGTILNGTFLAPARRDMLSSLPTDDNLRATIYKSAIISVGYWNPNTALTSNALRKSIQGIESGELSPGSAYGAWINEISNILNAMQEKIQSQQDKKQNEQ
jgi:ABC-type glycerol-3-phosphate transport system substrate-binding protein